VASESDPGESARVWYPALKLAVVQKRTAD